MEKPSFAAPAVSTKSSDELSVAAGVEAVSLASRGSHECQQEMPPGVGHAPDVQGTASDVVQAEGIPATAEREGQGQRSGVGNTVDLNVSPDLLLPGAYNHPHFQPNHPSVHTARNHCCTDLPAGLKLRTAELFPGGTAVPAAKPRLPPAAPQVTRALVVAAFDASKKVAPIRGELSKAEVVAYLLADALGIEILKEEAMRLGENATKDAIAAKDGAQKLKNVVSAKKAKLRQKATKDATIDLNPALEQLEKELDDDLRKHWRAPCTPAGLPDAKSKVVESRPRPKPKPAAAPATDNICPRARRILDMSESAEVATAVKAAFVVIFHTVRGTKESFFNEQLEVAELKYQHALRRLKQAYPEEFCGWGPKSAESMAAWAVDLGDRGFPVAAAQQAAKALGLSRREQPVCVPGCSCAGCA